MTAAAVAMAAAVATTAAISFSGSAVVTALGPRFTGVGVLLPTVFLGLEAFALEAGVFEGVALLSCGLERLGVFASAGLLGGFLVATSVFEADLGASGFEDFVVEEGRERGESAGFRAAGVDGLAASFFTDVEVLDACDAGALPAEGVVEADLVAAALAVEGVFGVAGLAVAVELLAVLAVGGRDEPVAGRVDGVVPVEGLVVLETGVLSGLGEATEPGLVEIVDVVLGAGGFFATAAVALDLTPFAVVDVVFLAAVVPVIGFAPLVATPVAFFSPTFAAVLLAVAAPVVPVGFLEGAEVVVLFLSAGVFFATPLV